MSLWISPPPPYFRILVFSIPAVVFYDFILNSSFGVNSNDLGSISGGCPAILGKTGRFQYPSEVHRLCPGSPWYRSRGKQRLN